MKVKRIGLIVWVSFLWLVTVAFLVLGNIKLYEALDHNAPFWVWAVVAVVLNGVLGLSAFDGLMSYTYDKLYPGMDEER